MFHHDSRDYNVATSDAAKKGRVKMEEIVHRGITGAEGVITDVQNRLVSDSIVRSANVRIIPAENGWSMNGVVSETPIHDHAFGQILEKSIKNGVPTKFADCLTAKGQWGKEELARIVNNLYSHDDGRHLVRRSDGQVKGFLSDKFRRLDSRPLLESFVGACKETGLLPIQGHVLDTKVCLRAVLPQVFEPIDNEVMLFGLEWRNSDFGDGGHQVSLWTMRVWCTNLAIGETCLRQVHIGKRLDDNIEYSQKTLEADTKANALALADTVKHSIGAGRVNAYLKAIQDASKDEIKGKDGIVNILKKHLGKEDIAKVTQAFESPDVVNLPPGNTTYRLSNAISWIAQSKDVSASKRLEMEKLAGNLMPVTSGKVVEA